MNSKRWAIQRMLDGGRVRCTYWAKGDFIYLSDDGEVMHKDGFKSDINYESTGRVWEEFTDQRERVVWSEMDKFDMTSHNFTL